MKPTPIALAVALAVAPAISSAQILEEVIVTAQKKAETLTEAPVAVSLVSGEEINDLAIFQADELGKLVTGLEVRYQGASEANVGLRGVGTFAQQTAPGRVGVYMDDYYMAGQSATALASMFDMANVQALKGPQGTLYGQPPPTGALILTTRDADTEAVGGHVRGSVVDPKGYNFEAAVNVPVGDSFAFRISGLLDKRETGVEVKRDPSTGNPLGNVTEERNRSAIRAKLLWEPTDSLSVKFGYMYMEADDSDAYTVVETFDRDLAGFNLDADDRIAVADAESSVSKKEDTLITFKLDWAIGEMDLSWFTGTLESNIYRVQDNDKTEVPSVQVDLGTEFGGGSDGIQHEIRLAGTAFDNWDWIVGAYYGKGKSFTQVDTPAGVGGGVFKLHLDIPTEGETKAIFTHNAIRIGDDTELTVGVRYNDFTSDAQQRTTGDFLLGSAMLPGGGYTDPIVVLEGVLPCIDGSANPCVTGSGTDDQEWTGTVKLRHFFSDEFNLYGTVDVGFRPGAPNFDVSGIFQPDLNNYEGESVNSFEIGAKGDIFDGRARYTMAAFYSVYEDYQAVVTFEAYNTIRQEVGVARNAYVNVDEAVQRGVEADFRIMLTDNWMLYTGFTYANVEFTDGVTPCTDPSQPPVGPDNRFNVCDADGEVASAQPELTAVLHTEYTFPQLLGDSDGYVSALLNYKDEIEVPGDTAGRLKSDSYSTLDLFTGLRNEKWSAQLFAKNITDEGGVVSKLPLGFGYNELVVIPPRTIGFTASYNF